MRKNYDPFAGLEAGTVDLQLRSADFTAGGQLPESATGAGSTPGGADRCPQLSWDPAPAGTESLMLSVYDPDAPTPSGYWHWLVANLPADMTELEGGTAVAVPEGSISLYNDGATRDFQGAAPPVGDGPHRYFFTIHALDTRLDLDPETRPAVVHFLARGHILGRGILIGTWENA